MCTAHQGRQLAHIPSTTEMWLESEWLKTKLKMALWSRRGQVKDEE